ncbi:hypothetical protein CLU82_3316 [Flavobacterium sp. 5]|nr:hypothetical protein CLU82_3316 [Flavobacterium sp. 5]
MNKIVGFDGFYITRGSQVVNEYFVFLVRWIFILSGARCVFDLP